MGTARRYLRIDATDEAGARTAIQAKIDEHLAEFGYDDHSGQWNTKQDSPVAFYPDELFATGEAGVNWVREHCETDETIKLVRVRRTIPKNKSQQNKAESLKTKLAKLEQDVKALANQTGRNSEELWCLPVVLSEGVEVPRHRRSEIHSQALARTKAAKSSFKGCVKCKSRINLEFLERAACPVCGERSFLLTKTDEERLARLDAKQNDKINEWQAMSAQYDDLVRPVVSESDDDWYWLAVADCPN